MKSLLIKVNYMGGSTTAKLLQLRPGQRNQTEGNKGSGLIRSSCTLKHCHNITLSIKRRKYNIYKKGTVPGTSIKFLGCIFAVF